MKRSLQIDVLDIDTDKGIVLCNFIIDGRDLRFWTTEANYNVLVSDKVFLRDGKERDSANVLNTTNVFIENE